MPVSAMQCKTSMKILDERHIRKFVGVGPVLIAVHRATDRYFVDHERTSHRSFTFGIGVAFFGNTTAASAHQCHKHWTLALVGDQGLISDRHVDPFPMPRRNA